MTFCRLPRTRALRALGLSDYPAVTDGAHSEPKWYDVLRDWAVKFGQDAVAFIDAFLERGGALAVRADDMKREPAFRACLLGGRTDNGNSQRACGCFYRQCRGLCRQKNLYNYLNALTFGLLDMFEGAFFPEEFMSFRHVMDMIGVADDFIDDVAGAADDFVDDAARAQYYDDILGNIARREGEIIAVFDADDLNAAYKALNPTHEAPYFPSTSVYQIEINNSTNYVRVYDNINSGQAGG